MNRSLLKIYTHRSVFRSLILNKNISTTASLNGHFTKDVKPGPYPETEEQRIAAAKKYGLSPSEYKPISDPGLAYGDYPDIKPISPDMKDPYEDYDDPYFRRNFGEPLHIHSEYLTPPRVSFKPDGSSGLFKLSVVLAVSGTFFLIAYLTSNKTVFIPVLPKQLPRNKDLKGEKHYTFETEH